MLKAELAKEVSKLQKHIIEQNKVHRSAFREGFIEALDWIRQYYRGRVPEGTSEKLWDRYDSFQEDDCCPHCGRDWDD